MFRSLGEVLQTLSAQGVIDGLGEDRTAIRSLRQEVVVETHLGSPPLVSPRDGELAPLGSSSYVVGLGRLFSGPISSDAGTPATLVDHGNPSASLEAHAFVGRLAVPGAASVTLVLSEGGQAQVGEPVVERVAVDVVHHSVRHPLPGHVRPGQRVLEVADTLGVNFSAVTTGANGTGPHASALMIPAPHEPAGFGVVGNNVSKNRPIAGAWQHPSSPPTKRAASTKPAAKSFREDTLPAKEVHTDRCMTIANPNELPRSAVVIHLVVDNSGGRQEEGAGVRRLRNAFRERQRELDMRVLVSG